MNMKRTISVRYFLAASVALLTGIVYLSSLRHKFVELDDPFYILGNTHIRSLNVDFFRWAFFDFYASNWHPLTWISHAVDYAVWGLDPAGHHLTNVLLHTANTFLVVLLVVTIMEVVKEIRAADGPSTFFDERSMLITAGVTGLLFGLHPLHVESVAWVSERKDLLCGFFFLLSLMRYAAYVRGIHGEAAEHPGSSRFFHKEYLLSLVFFILALLSKPMAVSLPVVLLILDWHPFQRIPSLKTLRFVLVEKLPFIAFSLFSSIVTVLAQKAGGALQPLVVTPLSIRFLVAARSFVLYLWKMACPVHLVPYYPYPRNASLFSPEYFLSIALLVGITAGCLIVVKKQKLWLAVWACYIVTLIPVIGIVQVGGQPMADRYTYLPGLGPFLLIGLAAAWALNKGYTLVRRRLPVTVFSAALAVMVLSAMSFLTLQQIAVWRSGMELLNYIIDKGDPVPLAYYNRGLLFYEQGRFDRALADDNAAIALEPAYFEAYSNRGQIFDNEGRFEQAIADYDKALSLNPSYFQAYFNRGLAFLKLRQPDKAIADFDRAIALNPDYSDAYQIRAAAFYFLRQFDKAIADFDRAIALNPNYQAYANRGQVYKELGQLDRAADDFNKAAALRRRTP